MPTRLLIATTNAGKLKEIRRVLDGLPLDLRSLADFPLVVDVDETGRTFAENALIKAERYAAQTGLPTVAEDSGLVIDALGGRPGVESARYPGTTYADKFEHLYRELAPYPRPWTARFVCSLAVVEQTSGTGRRALGTGGSALGTSALAVLFTCESSVEGEISDAPRAAGGFGYDPIFFYPPYRRTLAEVSEEEKIAVSHRGRAFGKLSEWLRGTG